MNKVHLLCSANWGADPERMLKPLETMLEHLRSNSYELCKVIIVRGNQAQDQEYCAKAQKLLPSSVDFSAPVDTGQAVKVAGLLSRSAEEAVRDGAELWIDLTPGPKQRIAIFFAAASAIRQVQIVYSERVSNGQYRITNVPLLESYNDWLGTHGIRIRNYGEELHDLALKAQAENSGKFQLQKILAAISDLLTNAPGAGGNALGIKSELLTLAEWTANTAVPTEVFAIQNLSSRGRNSWQSKDKGKNCDDNIRNANNTDEWHRSAGRVSQAIYQIRCLYAHDAGKEEDALMMLDGLAFLAARFRSLAKGQQAKPAKQGEILFLAADGDDVGRRFEEYLAVCVEDRQVDELLAWSQSIQRGLSERLIELMDEWEGQFIARTGDGFLASVPAKYLHQLSQTFQPKLPATNVTTTIGIGRSVKDAYLALKLGKARNRGGGLFFSLNPPEELVLWQGLQL